MKKKNIILIVVCSCVVLAGIVAMLLFIFLGKGDDIINQDEKEYIGTWEVVADVQLEGDQPMPTLLDNVYMIIGEEDAAYYNGDTTTPAIESKYTITTEGLHQKINLTDKGISFIFENKTKDVMRLYSSQYTYKVLVRYPNSDLSATTVDLSSIQGKWNVTLKADGLPEQVQELDFGSTSVEYYVGGTLAKSTEYTWSANNTLDATGFGLSFEYHPLTADKAFLVETNTARVWVLERIKQN